GKAISGAQGIDSETTVVFHAGTSTTPDGLKTSGGRVLAVTARAATLAQALEEVYRGTSQITFEGIQLRRDIGKKGLNRGV
ncbi:MAG: phosphoribosylamine--glycine ligase, partial [Bacteroidetes Order II. Incertae sedis bacterium]|nr:phosphoribosylamine--glycine ligase [Bacteroidetes Order II. bacterium]